MTFVNKQYHCDKEVVTPSPLRKLNETLSNELKY